MATLWRLCLKWPTVNNVQWVDWSSFIIILYLTHSSSKDESPQKTPQHTLIAGDSDVMPESVCIKPQEVGCNPPSLDGEHLQTKDKLQGPNCSLTWWGRTRLSMTVWPQSSSLTGRPSRVLQNKWCSALYSLFWRVFFFTFSWQIMGPPRKNKMLHLKELF